MTDRERIVEVIAEAMASHPSLRVVYADKPEDYMSSGHLYGDPEMPEYDGEAQSILAALEAAGFAIYRPDDCATVFVDSCLRDHEGCRAVDEHVPDSPPGSYSLVPVGGDS